MARRSSQPAPAEAAPKRRASTRLSASHGEVKRVKSNATLSGKSTSKKSKYFEADSSDEPSSDSEDGDSGSAYEGNESEASPDPESEELQDSEEEVRAKGGQRRKGGSGAKADPGKELWREAETTRRRGVKYQDETLHPNTKLFLLDLAKNNDRQWFKAHDPDFRAAKKDFETFVETLTSKIAEKDATIPELPTKDLIFRIYRDIRFSKNPLPYKIHFSAAWSRTGKKGPYAAYYVHFQPGSSFVGCGLWNPEADALATLREDIDENAQGWKEILRAPDMRREFLNNAPDDDDAVVRAFAHHNKESALKTKPKGYEADNANIELLRLRSFTIGRPITDAEIMAADAQDRIVSLIGIMEPFVTHLNSVVMPDP
ncbi:hypothetical protein N7468_000653 [Penicillium chermesinum]|uniref:DUF2461 domain-containing protein n=1 Tax=Penicillium chermesinum TaxID=63820 RepID=A0A9W9TYL4_9EURO|nr:uncharacterized protein N7468_000653 [Penicillium chermesinum]KAJ5249202.1 hypothetical protein N7468_000653 [Penicillium chermesinum]